jgi:hypothetical protein
MLDRSEIIGGFRSAIQHGTRYEEPYLLYTFSPFTQSLYDKILASLPRDEDYSELKHWDALRPDGTSARLVFPLKADRIRRVFSGETREFWLDLAHILLDTQLGDLFKSAFEPELKKRFGTPLGEIKVFPAPMLLRDFSQYKLYIHKDRDTKIITTQYYLPADYSQRHLGTNIYRQNPDGKFDLVRKLEFTPRTSYCFAVSQHSWHSVDPMNAGESPRNSMMLIYYSVPGIDVV